MERTELPPLATRKPLSRRKQVIVVLVLALITIAVIALGWAGGNVLGSPAKPPAESNAKKPAVSGGFRPTQAQLANLKIVPVEKQVFRSEYATDGKIAANADRTTPVFSPYSGRVTKILANLGDSVKQGAPLLTVDASEFVQGQNDLVAAAAALRTARSQLSQAELTEKRKHGLYDIKAGSLQDWQQSQAELVSAQNAVRSAEATRAAVRNRLRILGKKDAEIDAIESAQKLNSAAAVTAPINGTVIDRQVGLGQYIQSNAATPIYTIGDLSSVWLIANVREQDEPKMQRGAPVEVRVPALPGKVFKARITYIAPSVDPATHRIAVRSEIPNPEGLLKPEMFASFVLVSGGDSDAVGVPEEAVLYEGETARVWIQQQDGTLALRPIQTGRASHGMVEVTAGLSPGERVVTGGSLFIDSAARTRTE